MTGFFLQDQLVDGTIDLDPDYQRGVLFFNSLCYLYYNLPLSLFSFPWSNSLTPSTTDIVWTKEKQSGLVDSIFRNYYIPPIVFGTQLNLVFMFACST